MSLQAQVVYQASCRGKLVWPCHHDGASPNSSVSSFWEALGTKPLPVVCALSRLLQVQDI